MPSLKQIGKKIEDSIPLIQKAAQDALVVASQDALGQVTQRIFNRGQDVNGNPIGIYENEDYIKKRTGKGLQVGYKDFQFNGDLFRSVDIGTSEDKIVIGITNEKSAQVSVFLEERTGKTVFVGSDQEVESALDTAQAFFMDSIEEIMKTWGN